MPDMNVWGAKVGLIPFLFALPVKAVFSIRVFKKIMAKGVIRFIEVMIR
jgi:hypothetical protein